MKNTDNKSAKNQRKTASSRYPPRSLNSWSRAAKPYFSRVLRFFPFSIAAQLSNIGGGSKATGGKGIADGFNTIVQNQKAKTILQTISQKNLKDTASPLISDKKKGKRKKK